MTATVFVLNGPNLNLLGLREPEIYGSETLNDIEDRVTARGKALGLTVDFRQTNIEGQLVDWIQEARTKAKGIIINPAAYTHTSVALRDALKAVGVLAIEVHLSNIHRRETFRHHSYLSELAEGVICGLGWKGYLNALEFALDRLAPAAAGSPRS